MLDLRIVLPTEMILPSHAKTMSPESKSTQLLGPPLQAGDLGSLDGMRITAILGRGGMAEVFRAEDPLLGQPVAVKLIRPEHANDPGVRARFLREGRILSALQSEYVIQIHRVGESDGIPYIVMEFLEGSSLDSWLIRQRKSVTYTTTCKIARDVLRGLAAIHSKGIIHRDIKPSNLWIDSQSNKVRVLDLGMARQFAGEGSITLEGAVGTAAYMSPEQSEGEDLDSRSDLFSLGVVLYQLLAGCNPFQKENSLASITALVTEEPTLLHFCRPDIPPELESLIHAFLSKDREKRPADAKTAFNAVAAIGKKLRQERREGDHASGQVAYAQKSPIPVAEPLTPKSLSDPARADTDSDLLHSQETEVFPPQPKYPFLEAAIHFDDLGSLGGHRVISLLGRGAMGYVFRGVDKNLGRAVAIKVIRPDAASEPAARRRFLRESRLLALLKNEHIVTIYQAGETSLVPYLVMECLEGVPLDVWLRRQGKRVTPAVAIKVAKDTLRGLTAIHQSQMVHRDIKPANLWVDKDASRVKVLDFGLTRGPTAEDRSTLTGGILGTPAYMAPEQAAGKVADARSDLFSLGIVIYEMLAGANPFARESAVASMNAVAHDVLPSLSLVRKDLSLGLVRLVESLLAKTPADRPESSAKALEAFLSLDIQGKQAPSLEELLPPPSPISKHDSKATFSAKGSGTKLAGSNPQFGEKPPNQQGQTKQTPVQKQKKIPDWLTVGILTFSVVLVLGLMAVLLRKWLG